MNNRDFILHRLESGVKAEILAGQMLHDSLSILTTVFDRKEAISIARKAINIYEQAHQDEASGARPN